MDIVRYFENMLQYRENMYMALSGGSTPQLMFEILAKDYVHALPWEKIHFFWVDERCVSEMDEQSNYGTAKRILFDHVPIPHQNIHYIRGLDDPLNEVVRYTGEILSFVPCMNNIPVFDLILLGMGNDGHTASIFPGQLDLFQIPAICAVSQHPETNQKRITLTGKVINNAIEIVFLVTGKSKADKIRSLFEETSDSFSLPAKKIKPVHGKLSWYLDKEASIDYPMEGVI
jgi:6-phosphogluconolactonase